MKIFFHDVEISFRMWKYGTDTIANSEFLLYSSLIEMLEFDDDGLALRSTADGAPGAVRVDFVNGAMAHRRTRWRA